jgi:hypothetical protein
MEYLIVAIVAFFLGFLLSQVIDNELIISSEKRAEKTAKKYAARDFLARNLSRIENGERAEEAPAKYKW